MRIKCFSIPALTPDEACEEVSSFLASHRILTVDREFIADGPASHWAICVTYLPSTKPAQQPPRAKVDYRERLSPEDFAVFSRLRALRKQLAERDGVPAYALFTNEQLAAMVKERFGDAQRLASLPGVGPGRVEKYGAAFIEALSKEPERAAT